MSDLKNYSIYDIAKDLIILIDTARKEGILAMEQMVEDKLMPALLKNAIRLIIDGTESEIVISIIDQYLTTQNLDREELAKIQIIRKGIEDILYYTSPYETLLSMAVNLSYKEMIQLINLFDKLELEYNLDYFSWYQKLPNKNEKADIRMQEVLELDPDKLLELMVIMDAESVYFALKGSSIDIVRKICKKTGDFVGSILTKYLRGEEPKGVFHEVNYCQDKMAAVSAMLKEHALIQFPKMYETEKGNKIIKEITHLQQAEMSSYYGDETVKLLKMAAMYSLGYRYGYYQELGFRLGIFVVNGNGKRMNIFKEYLAMKVPDLEIRKMISAGFELLLHKAYDTTKAVMYAAVNCGDFEKSIHHYQEIINNSKFYITVVQSDFEKLRRIECPLTINFTDEADTSDANLMYLVKKNHEHAIGIVYMLGDERVRNLIEENCVNEKKVEVLHNVLRYPLNNERYQDAMKVLIFCSYLRSKIQSVYQLEKEELIYLVNSIDEYTLAIVLKMENGELAEKIMNIRPSIKEKMQLMWPMWVYSQECNEALDKLIEVAAAVRLRP